LRAIITSRTGGAYDIETLQRDSQALYNTGRFSDVVWEAEPGSRGAIVRFVVVERPLIQSIEYQVDDTVTIQEILERFQQREVKLRVETLYNEGELGRAAATLQELLAERGRRTATVLPLVEPIWPASTFKSWPPSTVKITFRVEEKR
jgi:outer membrane protein assembly factor BamA